MTNQIESFVDATKVAEFLGIPERSVLAMARENQIPAHPINAGTNRRQWRFKLSEVDAHFAQKAK